MKTTDVKSNSKVKALLATIGIVAALIFTTCLVLHIAPGVMADSIIDFSLHHYFLMGFISLTVAVACWKMYTSIDVKIEAHYQKKNTPYTRTQKKRTLMFKNILEHYFKKVEEQSEFIERETLTTLKFPEEDVLKSDIEKQQRQRDLQKAMVLGNSFKQKVIVMFRDYKSSKRLATTIWHSNTEHISLKGGIVLPVKSIYKIEF